MYQRSCSPGCWDWAKGRTRCEGEFLRLVRSFVDADGCLVVGELRRKEGNAGKEIDQEAVRWLVVER